MSVCTRAPRTDFRARETVFVDFLLPHRIKSIPEWRRDMNFEEKIETQIEALRVFFYGFLKVGCPYFNDFDNEFITIDDVIDFTIYEGIEKWVIGEWKAKNELAQKYVEAMNGWKKSIRISFLKITAHSNNKYNDMADALAKSALIEGNGIPKIKKGDYWFTADGINRQDLLAVIELIKEQYDSNITENRQTIAHGVLIA